MTHRLLLVLALFLPACSDPAPIDDAGRSDAGPRPDTAGNDVGSVDAPVTLPDAAGDPYAEARAVCIAEMNRLRATMGLPAYTRWGSAEACLDQQATADQMSGTPHGAWGAGTYPECNGNAQNECLGQGPEGVASCLQQMWDERNQAGCAGCDACRDAYRPDCPGCDFFGSTTGDVCGHYVNMSALYFTEAACGFSPTGGWVAINFR